MELLSSCPERIELSGTKVKNRASTARNLHGFRLLGGLLLSAKWQISNGKESSH